LAVSAKTPSTPNQPAEAGTLERRARIMRRVNVVMRLALRLPFPTPLSSRLMLVTHTGRKTGRAYRQPVSYVRDADTLLTPGGGRWTRNLQDGHPVIVRLRGGDVIARPELVGDPDEVGRLLTVMRDRSPRLASFVPFIDRDGPIDRAKLETALGHGFRVVRWHLDRGTRS
jgi:deazaflavin-dependent oxidoreductase (nitroreductase family)